MTDTELSAATLDNLIKAVKGLEKDRDEAQEILPYAEEAGDQDMISQCLCEIEHIEIVQGAFGSMLRKAREKALNPERHLLPDGDVPF